MRDNSGRSGLKFAILNYAGAAAFAALIGVFAFGMADPANLIAMKAVFAPFFLLASRSLSTFFKAPVDMQTLNARSIETQILSASLVAGFFVIVMWNADKALSNMASDFLILFTVMSVTNISVLAMRQRRAKSPET